MQPPIPGQCHLSTHRPTTAILNHNAAWMSLIQTRFYGKKIIMCIENRSKCKELVSFMLALSYTAVAFSPSRILFVLHINNKPNELISINKMFQPVIDTGKTILCVWYMHVCDSTCSCASVCTEQRTLWNRCPYFLTQSII